MRHTIDLSLRDGFAIDRAETKLAHAIAVVTGDWSEAKELAKTEREQAINTACVSGLDGVKLAFAVVGYLDQSRSRLPV